jgi:hypothetical protein
VANGNGKRQQTTLNKEFTQRHGKEAEKKHFENT